MKTDFQNQLNQIRKEFFESHSKNIQKISRLEQLQLLQQQQQQQQQQLSNQLKVDQDSDKSSLLNTNKQIRELQTQIHQILTSDSNRQYQQQSNQQDIFALQVIHL